MNRIALSPFPTAPLQAVSEHTSLKILLAEHDGELRKLLALVLHADGHDVVETTDGSQLLEAIAALMVDGDRRDFDLIISEQGIPGISGLSVLTGLRSRGRNTPFILMTANSAVQASARRFGAVILDAPLNVQAIQRAIRETQTEVRADGCVESKAAAHEPR